MVIERKGDIEYSEPEVFVVAEVHKIKSNGIQEKKDLKTGEVEVFVEDLPVMERVLIPISELKELVK